VPGAVNPALNIAAADDDHEPSVRVDSGVSVGESPVIIEPVSYRKSRRVDMIRSTSTGKLLSFPLSTPIPALAAQSWNHRILETRDNLVTALDYLRDEYNEMLAGEPITAADEILSRVEIILRSDEKISWYTVVAKIRIHGPTSRDAKRKVLLLFPAVGNAAVKASDG
jgi:hypothetical protein